MINTISTSSRRIFFTLIAIACLASCSGQENGVVFNNIAERESPVVNTLQEGSTTTTVATQLKPNTVATQPQPTKENTEASAEADLSDNKVLLTWAPPESRENGEKLYNSEIDAYVIRYRVEGEAIFNYVEFDDDGRNQKEIDNLLPGNYEFSLAAIDEQGSWSDFSDNFAMRL